MKKFIFLLLFFSILGASWFFLRGEPIMSPVHKPTSPEADIIEQPGRQKHSVFVPYWTLGDEIAVDTDTVLLYFGVKPGERGLDTTDPGAQGLAAFAQQAHNHTTYLTVRMLDSKQNFTILENSSLQQALITDTITTAKEYGFDGIVLDLEVSALPFASVIDQIAAFNGSFYEAVKKENLHYAVTLYGDTFFRIRPFDVKKIGEKSDEIMIMAYDLHKSRGNPGPNFPLYGKDRFGYDYTRLIEQFSEAVPPEKLTVIFGLFGYDWVVDEKQNMVEHGDPLSYNQIAARFLQDCTFAACTYRRDQDSSESYVTYRDDEGEKHIVWFEDRESVAKKQQFLQTKGISSFSVWAYTYD